MQNIKWFEKTHEMYDWRAQIFKSFILLISNNKEIDVSGWQPGIYFLNIQAGNQAARKKIIISN